MSVKDTLESHSQDRPAEIKTAAGEFCDW